MLDLGFMTTAQVLLVCTIFPCVNLSLLLYSMAQDVKRLARSKGITGSNPTVLAGYIIMTHFFVPWPLTHSHSNLPSTFSCFRGGHNCFCFFHFLRNTTDLRTHCTHCTHYMMMTFFLSTTPITPTTYIDMRHSPYLRTHNSVKTLRRDNVHAKTEVLTLQFKDALKLTTNQWGKEILTDIKSPWPLRNSV